MKTPTKGAKKLPRSWPGQVEHDYHGKIEECPVRLWSRQPEISVAKVIDTDYQVNEAAKG